MEQMITGAEWCMALLYPARNKFKVKAHFLETLREKEGSSGGQPENAMAGSLR